MRDGEPRSAGAAPPARRMLTLVVPAMNEEANLPKVYDEVTAVMAGQPYDYEVIVIDNASTDGTAAAAAALCARATPAGATSDSAATSTSKSRIAAGLRFARGDAALVLFSDLQDPPEMIPDFLRKWEEGHDVVYGVLRQPHRRPALEGVLARLFYRIVNALSEVEITPNATDFRLCRAGPSTPSTSSTNATATCAASPTGSGSRRCPIVYDRDRARPARARRPSFYLLNLAANAITCFSIKPLQLFSLSGAVLLAGRILPGAGLLRRLAPGVHRARPDDRVPADAVQPGRHAAGLRRHRRVHRPHLHRNEAAARCS